MFQCRKDKGAVQIAGQIANIGCKHFCLPGKHEICQRSTKLKIQNDDDNANTKQKKRTADEKSE